MIGHAGSEAEAEWWAQLQSGLGEISDAAARRDAESPPRFPETAVLLLEELGALAWNARLGAERPGAAAELALVRSVARADGSVGRIFDGHLNAVERLAVQAPREMAERELAAVRTGQLRCGVWGGDPVGGEGPPARVLSTAAGDVLRGVKTFCSGAGGLHRAMVLARAAGAGPQLSVWIDLTDRRVEIDEGWYRSAGLRASVSHRVLFNDVPVLARLGGPGAISENPWFSRDALRTAASWAGMAEQGAQAAVDELSARPARGPLEGLACGRIMTAARTIEVWMQAAARAMDGADPELSSLALHARAAISDACRTLLDEAARACGSRPFAHGGTLDRVRRDLEVFLLQHRLDPLLARAGEATLSRAGR